MFSKCANPEDGGGVKRIIMGLDRHTRYAMLPFAGSNKDLLTWSFSPFRTPCGFCFVEFYTHAEALASMRYVSGTKLDERIIRCDLDLGYKEGRQFGRGKSGGQVRDEHRQDYDPGRGGWGAQAQRLEIERRRQVEERYADAEHSGPMAIGGEEWKHALAPSTEATHKRARSPDDEDDGSRQRARVDEDSGRM